ncbi:MAG: T9SS type A sorting domain-containing protein [Bacteroidota bacterium]
MKQNFTSIFISTFLLLFSATMNHAQTPLYGESFPNGLPADWTADQQDGQVVNASSNWIHTTTGPAGLQFGIDPLESTTSSDGWMLFDSDINCNAVNQDVWLISPEYDCSSISEVFVSFETYYRKFNDRVFLEVSTDGMVTWQEIPLFADLLNNEWAGEPDGSENPVIAIEDITQFASNAPSVHIAFRFLSNSSTLDAGTLFGCAYSWQIDDVGIWGENPNVFFLPANDITSIRGAAANNAQTPASQIYPISFLLDIQNNGLNEATGVQATATIEEAATGNVVFNESISIPNILSIDPDSDDDVSFDNIWPSRFTPPATPGGYLGYYTVTSDSSAVDEDTSNDTLSFGFLITDTVFSKSLLVPSPLGNLGGIAPVDPDWTYGAGYYVPNGDGWVASSVTFAISSTDDTDFIGSLVNVTLYRWEDVNGDGDATADERGAGNPILGGELLSSFTYTIDGSETNENIDITVPLENFDNGGPVFLENDAQYIVALEMINGANATEPMRLVADDEISYLNSWFVNDSLANQGLPGYVPQHNAFSSTDTGFETPLLATFGFSPRINLNINLATSVKEELDEANKVEFYPNPANEIVTMDMEFVNTMDKVNVRITDATGRTMHETTYSNVLNEKYTYNVSHYAAGTYFAHIQTAEGSRTKRFVVLK